MRNLQRPQHGVTSTSVAPADSGPLQPLARPHRDPAAAQLTSHRPPLHALTGIRFLAAMYVVVFHSRVGAIFGDHGLRAAANFFENGYLAVPLFFLLSGLILAYTYAGQLDRPGYPRRFWEARFARIWPVYALSLLLSSVPSFNFPQFRDVAAALLMVQAWNPLHPELAGIWNFVCWTLSVEAFFYLCFPPVQRWLERLQTGTQVLIFGAMVAYCLAVNSAAHTLGAPTGPITRYLPLPVLHLGEFFAGVCIGNAVLRRAAATSVPLPGRGAWTYLSALGTIALLCRNPGRWTAVIVVGFSGLLFGLASERTLLSRFLSTPGMLLGGGISYSIYLMQMPVKQWVMRVAPSLHLGSDMRLAANTACLLIVSALLFKFAEQPARLILRAFFSRIEGRREDRI